MTTPRTAFLREATVVAIALSIVGVPSLIDAQASTPGALVQRAAAAMGGAAALRALTNVTVEFNSATFGIGQEETPQSPARATFTFGRIINDYRGGRRLTAQESRPVAGPVQRQRTIITPSGGLVDNNGAQNPAAPGAITAAAAALRAQPERMIVEALDNPPQLSAMPARRIRGELMDGVRFGTGAGAPSLWFDRLSGLPVAIERVTDDPILGDRSTETIYTRWEDAGGVMLPRQIDVHVNGRLQQHIVITTASTNSAVTESDFVIPDSITARASTAAAPPGSQPITVTLAELGPNVWRAEGGSHHSLVVRQATGLVVVEGPQSPARTRAVLDTLRARFPGVAVRTLVPTHHHWDHTGGVREYLAHVAEVIAHARNVEFVRGIGAAQKTVAPDALSRGGRMATVRAANAQVTILGAGETAVQLLELPTAHAQGMLAAYVPSLRILFVSDVLTPGPTLAPAGSRELVAMVRARGLTVDRVVGGHGGIAAWADVERAAAR
jgi:glyoxylase-like metal-dependent hydrolase (beta-lactamase superfamily II)